MSGSRIARKVLNRLEDILGGWSFAAFLLFAILFSELFLALVMVLPAGAGAVGAFASEFRTWCLGADPKTGHTQWAYVAMYILNPIMVAAVIWGVWHEPLRAALQRGPRVFLIPALLAVIPVLGSAGALYAYQAPSATGPLPFPAEALRTVIPAPTIELIDQDSAPFRLSSLRGRVVLVTGVYSSCGTACPMMLAGIRKALEQLVPQERAQIDIVAVTLDPERDRPAKMKEFARAYGIGDTGAGRERAHFLTGDLASVNHALDAMDYTRQRDPATGVIDHVRLFLLLDRSGKIAYRFTLGEDQQRWMTEALRLLAAEQVG